MTRAASLAGFVLAAILLWETVPSGSLWWVAALLMFVAAIGVWRRNTIAHVGLFVLAVATLGRSLPMYFRTGQMWPYLPMIALAAGALGFGLVGFLIDRYRVPPEADRPL